MFRVDPTGTMMINKGDTAVTNLYVNEGTPLEPVLYDFSSTLAVSTSKNLSSIEIQIDKIVWINKVLESGTYEFDWVYSSTLHTSYWVLDGNRVDLSQYGIYLPYVTKKNIPTDATITVTYTLLKQTCEIYFYVWNVLQQIGDTPVLKKTIKPYSNTVITELDGEELSTETLNCVDAYGNILLYINPEDTNDIVAGEYRYQVIAKLYKNGNYVTNTITNRTPFLIIDDDYSDRVW